MKKHPIASVTMNVFNFVVLGALFMFIGGFVSYAFEQASMNTGLLSLGFSGAGVVAVFSFIFSMLLAFTEKKKLENA